MRLILQPVHEITIRSGAMIRAQASKLFLLIAVFLIGTGCKSTYLATHPFHPYKFNGGSEPVFVTNPEMKLEYELLQRSGIYALTNQPTGRTLTLNPIHDCSGGCANPLMLSGMTLGILPGFLPADIDFSYDFESGGERETRHHMLPFLVRYSMWDWLVAQTEDEVHELWGRALANSGMLNEGGYIGPESEAR
jgi:hypothetical protein